MSFDLLVSGGRPVTIEKWRQRIARFGAVVEFHPGFRFETHFGFLPVAITIDKPTMFPGAARYHSAGRIDAGFSLDVTLGPAAAPEAIAARRAFFSAMLVESRARGPQATQFPALVLELLDRGEEQSLGFTTPAGRSGADYLAQVVAAAAYALEAGGRLHDPQAGGSSEGDQILSTVARQLTEFLDNDDVAVGAPFVAWD